MKYIFLIIYIIFNLIGYTSCFNIKKSEITIECRNYDVKTFCQVLKKESAVSTEICQKDRIFIKNNKRLCIIGNNI